GRFLALAMTIGAASALPLAPGPGGRTPPGAGGRFGGAGGVTFRYLQGGPTQAGPPTGAPPPFPPGSRTWPEGGPPLPRFLASPAAVHALLRRAVFYDLRYADEGWVRTMVEDWAPPDRRKAYVATGFALRRPDASVAGALEHITIPTYVIWGREDPQFLWGEGEAASRRMPTSQFAVLSGCGHFPMVERSMETANLLTDFLAEDVGL